MHISVPTRRMLILNLLLGYSKRIETTPPSVPMIPKKLKYDERTWILHSYKEKKNYWLKHGCSTLAPSERMHSTCETKEHHSLHPNWLGENINCSQVDWSLFVKLSKQKDRFFGSYSASGGAASNVLRKLLQPSGFGGTSVWGRTGEMDSSRVFDILLLWGGRLNH